LIDFFLLISISLKKYHKFIVLIIFATLFLFTGLRPELGGFDYQVYKELYNQTPNLFNFSFDNSLIIYDFFYIISNSLIKIFTNDFSVYIIIYTFITHIFLFKAIKENSKYFFYSLFIYFSSYYFWHNFTLLRQNAAIIIFWLSIKYVKDNKFKQYIFLILIATFFHKSAILLLFLYPFIKLTRKISIKKEIILFSFLTVLKPISYYITNLIFLILSYLNIGRGNLEAYLASSNGGINKLFIIETTLLLLFIFIKRNNSIIRNNRIFITLSLITLLISVWFSNYEAFARFLEYYRIYYLVLIPVVFKTIKNIYLKYSFFFVTIFYFLFRLYRYLNSFDGGSLLNYNLM
jgi:transmembrane protein EpsG